MLWIGNNNNNMHNNHSNVFINPNTKSMWMLVIDNKPIFRTEFKDIASDEDIELLHGSINSINDLKEHFGIE